MTLKIGQTAPDFTATTTEGEISFHNWIGDSWCVLFSHPKDFTPVCTTELGYMARIKPEFDKRGVKIIGLSVDAVDNLFVIGPDKQVKLILVYPMSTGRNFDEVLRVIDSMQLTAKHQVATPVNWKHGDEVIIVPALKDEDAKTKFPGGWRAEKPYLRYVPQPK